jgi:hypothetical protein
LFPSDDRILGSYPSKQTFNDASQKVFFKLKKMQTPNDHAQMHRILDFPVERFGSLAPEKQDCSAIR